MNSFAKAFLTISQCTLVCLLAVASLNAAQRPSNIENSITAALRAKDFNQALQLARSALDQSPKDPKMLTLEGIALSGLGRDREALVAYEAALAVSADYLPALEGAAQIEYNEGSECAAALLHRILKIRPKDSTTHAMLGALAFKHGDCKAAVEHFRASGDAVFSQNAAREEYGFCLVRLDESGEAVAVYQRALGADPTNARARLRLAAAQYLADRPEDAVATLQPVLHDSVDPDILDIASAAYEKTGNTPRAVELLRQAIVLRPDNPKYYLDFSTLCFDHASFQVGVDMLNAGLRQLPNSASLYLARGILRIQLGDIDKGQADFEEAQRLDPRQGFSSESEGLTKLQTGNLGAALETVRVQLKDHPDDGFLQYLLADILDQQGATPGSTQFREAVQSATRAIQLRPDLVTARDLLSGLYLKSGDLDGAIEQCRLALRSDYSDQVALYHLTQALRKSGKRAELSELLKRLATLREDSRKKEAVRNRYKLVEIPDADDRKP